MLTLVRDTYRAGDDAGELLGLPDAAGHPASSQASPAICWTGCSPPLTPRSRALNDDVRDAVKTAYAKLSGLAKKRVAGRADGELAL
jgi:hypothetical protein